MKRIISCLLLLSLVLVMAVSCSHETPVETPDDPYDKLIGKWMTEKDNTKYYWEFKADKTAGFGDGNTYSIPYIVTNVTLDEITLELNECPWVHKYTLSGNTLILTPDGGNAETYTRVN